MRAPTDDLVERHLRTPPRCPALPPGRAGAPPGPRWSPDLPRTDARCPDRRRPPAASLPGRVQAPAHRSAAAARGAEAEAALHQARPTALHQPPRHRPRLRARAAPRRRPDGLLRRLQPAPQDQLGRGRADGRGVGGRVRRDQRGAAGRPRAAAGRSRRQPARRDRRRGGRRGARRHQPAGPRRGVAVGRAAARGALADALRAVELFLAAETVPVERLLKDGRRTLDARAAVVALRASEDDGDPPCATLHLVVRHVTPAVRPDDVLSGLRSVADLATPVPPAATRTAQGPLTETGEVADPLAPDRALPGRDRGNATGRRPRAGRRRRGAPPGDAAHL